MKRDRMYSPCRLGALAFLLLLAIASFAQPPGTAGIAGTYSILWSSSDGGPQFLAMLQFSSDGNVMTTETDEFAVSQGVWERIDAHNYGLTVYQYAFPGLQQAYQGTFKVRAKVKLAHGKETLAGPYHLEFFDPNGNLLFTDDGTISGNRVHVDPMP